MFKMPKWSADNPLGIIALFISLIYGMSALLLGTSVDSLEAHNETILVIFTVLFPFVVLGVFGWLVACHHKKLYGPKDFKSDEGFLIANGSERELSTGDRLRHEVEGDEKIKDEQGEEVDGEVHDTPTASEQLENMVISKESHLAKTVREAYMAESLVFQELQRTLDGAVLREVDLVSKNGMRYRADGVITKGDTQTVIEVKVLGKHNQIKMIKSAFAQVKRYRDMLERDSSGLIDLMIVFVVDSEAAPMSTTAHAMLKNLSAIEGVQYKLFEYSELMKKYGLFGEEPEEDE